MPHQRPFKIDPRILWHEGMLLAPQHFQQNDRRLEQLLNIFNYVHNPFAFGIHRIDIDFLSLSQGVFKIIELEAILPDGTILYYNSASKEGQDYPLEINLKNLHDKNAHDYLKIWITLPEISENKPFFMHRGRYYQAEGYPVFDEMIHETHERDELLIPRLHPHVQLTCSQTLPSNHTGFMIAEISTKENYTQTSYMPPCLYLSPEMWLFQSCKMLAAQLRDKATYLTGIWQNQLGTAMMAETEMLLRPLLMAIPQLEALLNTSIISPYGLYQTLVDVLSTLTPLRLSQVPPVLFGYDHYRLKESFDPLIELIQSYIDSIEQSYTIFPFHQKERLFYLYLGGQYVQTTLYVGVRIPKGGTEASVETWMQDAVIASDFAVDLVRNRRITGAKRWRIDPVTQFEMMPSRGVIIFEIPFDTQYLAVDQNLNIFNPNDLSEHRPSELILHIKKGDVYDSYAAAS